MSSNIQEFTKKLRQDRRELIITKFLEDLFFIQNEFLSALDPMLIRSVCVSNPYFITTINNSLYCFCLDNELPENYDTYTHFLIENGIRYSTLTTVIELSNDYNAQLFDIADNRSIGVAHGRTEILRCYTEGDY